MPSAKRLLVVFVCWLASSALPLTHAQVAPPQGMYLIVEVDASFEPAPTSLLFTVVSSNAPGATSQFRVPNGGRASCASLEPRSDLTPNSVCGRPPTCYPPGMYSFFLEAEFPGDQTSERSNHVICQVFAQCRADCTPAPLPEPVAALVTADGDGNVQVPAPDAVQAAVQTLAQTPTPPVLPSMTAPVPTTKDVVDAVTPALQALPPAPV
jgi:hypothetical protein